METVDNKGKLLLPVTEEEFQSLIHHIGIKLVSGVMVHAELYMDQTIDKVIEFLSPVEHSTSWNTVVWMVEREEPNAMHLIGTMNHDGIFEDWEGRACIRTRNGDWHYYGMYGQKYTREEVFQMVNAIQSPLIIQALDNGTIKISDGALFRMGDDGRYVLIENTKPKSYDRL